MLEFKKGDKVILKGFTGIKLGVFTVESSTKKTISVLKKNGDEMIFDRKSGKQINVEEGKERYANSIIEDDGSFVAPSTVGAKRKKSTKKAAKKAKVEEEADEEEEEKPAPKKHTKKTGKKPVKKQPEPEEDEDEDDDDDFEDDDDEFEEVDE